MGSIMEREYSLSLMEINYKVILKLASYDLDMHLRECIKERCAIILNKDGAHFTTLTIV